MNAGDNSLIGGLLSATTLVAINYLVSYVTFRSKKMEALIEGRPQVIVHNGKILGDALTKCQLTHHELDAALREAGCSSVGEAHMVILENNGSISVIARKK